MALVPPDILGWDGVGWGGVGVGWGRVEVNHVNQAVAAPSSRVPVTVPQSQVISVRGSSQPFPLRPALVQTAHCHHVCRSSEDVKK